MKTVILAGGLGTRLRPAVKDKPKPMAEVLGRPFLEWQLKLLKKFNLRDIILSIGYLGDKIKNHFGDGKKFGVNIEYAEEAEPLGTGGNLKIAKPYLIEENNFLMINGDTYLDLDFLNFIKFHENKEALVTMALTRIKEPSKRGFVELDKDSRIISFAEKENSTGVINAGVQAFNSEVFNHMPSKKKFSLEHDLFPNLVETEHMYGYMVKGYFKDIGTPEDLKEIREGLREVV